MAETPKKTAEAPPTDETPEVPESKTADELSKDFDRQSEVREWGEVHEYTFADGTSAKVWKNKGSDHVNVQLRNVQGRGTTATTSENVTVNAANKILESAGQKAVDSVAAAGR